MRGEETVAFQSGEERGFFANHYTLAPGEEVAVLCRFAQGGDDGELLSQLFCEGFVSRLADLRGKRSPELFQDVYDSLMRQISDFRKERIRKRGEWQENPEGGLFWIHRNRRRVDIVLWLGGAVEEREGEEWRVLGRGEKGMTVLTEIPFKRPLRLKGGEEASFPLWNLLPPQGLGKRLFGSLSWIAVLLFLLGAVVCWIGARDLGEGLREKKAAQESLLERGSLPSLPYGGTELFRREFPGTLALYREGLWNLVAGSDRVVVYNRQGKKREVVALDGPYDGLFPFGQGIVLYRKGEKRIALFRLEEAGPLPWLVLTALSEERTHYLPAALFPLEPLPQGGESELLFRSPQGVLRLHPLETPLRVELMVVDDPAKVLRNLYSPGLLSFSGENLVVEGEEKRLYPLPPQGGKDLVDAKREDGRLYLFYKREILLLKDGGTPVKTVLPFPLKRVLKGERSFLLQGDDLLWREWHG